MAEDAARHEHRPRLGRGLAALLGDVNADAPNAARPQGVQKAPIEFLRPSSNNIRKNFVEEELEELADSIRARGVIQPILVRPIVGAIDAYEIVAGERRWRAAQRAGKHDIPILVLDVDDREALEIGLIENIQRSDLNPLEEAAGYEQLAAEHGYNHSDIARIVGKSRSHVANTLRLTNLPNHTRNLLASGAISAGHARALLAVPDPDILANRIVAHGLTVREVERLGERSKKSSRIAKLPAEIGIDTLALEQELARGLGTKVTIRCSGEAGEISISFRSFEQLEALCRRLTNSGTGQLDARRN